MKEVNKAKLKKDLKRFCKRVDKLGELFTPELNRVLNEGRGKNIKLGGIWKGVKITEEDIKKNRKEMRRYLDNK